LNCIKYKTPNEISIKKDTNSIKQTKVCFVVGAKHDLNALYVQPLQ
jgi:hypothetical protein